MCVVHIYLQISFFHASLQNFILSPHLTSLYRGQALYFASMTLWLLGKNDKAREYVDKMLKKSPSSVEGVILRGWVDLTSNREAFVKKANKIFEEVLNKYVSCPSIHPLIHSPTHPPTHSSTHPLIHASTHSSTHPSTHSSTHPPTHPRIHPLIHSSTHPLIHSSIHSSTHPLIQYGEPLTSNGSDWLSQVLLCQRKLQPVPGAAEQSNSILSLLPSGTD